MEKIHQEIASRLLNLNPQVDKEELFPTLTPGATEFTHSRPYAFCVATCLDRGTKAEIIWTIPYWIYQVVGHFDPFRFYQMSIGEISGIFTLLPKKPRYLNAAPRTFQEITRIVVDQFSGHAERIWTNKRAIDVRKTFLSVYGVGSGIANMAVILIEKAYGFQFSDLDHTRMDIKPDVHTTRVLYRLGVSAAMDENEAVMAARYLNPPYPGGIDGALWFVGRKWCLALKPTCAQCPMNSICPKVGV